MLRCSYILVSCCFLFACSDDIAQNKAKKTVPKSQIFTAKQLEGIYESEKQNKNKQQRLSQHKNLNTYRAFANPIESVDQSTGSIVDQQNLNKDAFVLSRPTRQTQVINATPNTTRENSASVEINGTQKVNPSTVTISQNSKKIKQTKSKKVVTTIKPKKKKPYVYVPIVFDSGSEGNEGSSSFERYTAKQKKSKYIRAGTEINTRLVDAISSNNNTPVFFHISVLDTLQGRLVNVSISCNYSLNNNSKRMDFNCHTLETVDLSLSISAEILDASKIKGLDGRLDVKKETIVLDAVKAGANDAISNIANQNPVEMAGKTLLSGAVNKKEKTINKEILYVSPQNVIIRFLRSF